MSIAGIVAITHFTMKKTIDMKDVRKPHEPTAIGLFHRIYKKCIY